MIRAFLGLGSNLGDRTANIEAAVAALADAGVKVVAVSPFYETDPVGPPQPDFINAACAVETDLPARGLLAVLKDVEARVGRGNSERWGPREIDVDLLLYGDEEIDEDGLRVPHPELTSRPFAMVPLLDLDPGLELPSGEPLNAFVEPHPAGVRRLEGP